MPPVSHPFKKGAWQEWATLADDASVWEGRREKGLLKAEYVDGYVLRLLIWPNPETGGYDEQAIDIAPECIRFFCERYGHVLNGSEAT